MAAANAQDQPASTMETDIQNVQNACSKAQCSSARVDVKRTVQGELCGLFFSKSLTFVREKHIVENFFDFVKDFFELAKLVSGASCHFVKLNESLYILPQETAFSFLLRDVLLQLSMKQLLCE